MIPADTVHTHARSKPKCAFLIKSACAALTVMVMSGCASLSTRAPEEVVAERAADRWAGLIKGDFKKAYSYNTPGYRGMVTQQRFQETRGRDGRVKAAEVYKVTCEEKDKCTARMKLTAYAPLVSSARIGKPSLIETYVNETWLLEDGKWWFFQKI